MLQILCSGEKCKSEQKIDFPNAAKTLKSIIASVGSGMQKIERKCT